jgi:hypothetical protein
VCSSDLPEVKSREQKKTHQQTNRKRQYDQAEVYQPREFEGYKAAQKHHSPKRKDYADPSKPKTSESVEQQSDKSRCNKGYDRKGAELFAIWMPIYFSQKHLQSLPFSGLLNPARIGL